MAVFIGVQFEITTHTKKCWKSIGEKGKMRKGENGEKRRDELEET